MGCGASGKKKYDASTAASDGKPALSCQVSFFEKLEVKKTPVTDSYQVGKASLGQGGFGKVTKGTRKGTKSEVRAIKQLPKDMTDAAAFVAEVVIASELDHPNIIKLYEVFEDNRNFYLVMELSTGGELFDAVVDAQSFNEWQAAHVMHQVLRGINYMHGKNICHRDVKAENFLLMEKKPIVEAVIKIIDFGIAVQFTPGVPMSGSSGTPYYIAPEVLNGSYDCKCDEWACGVLMYIMLSGQPPFHGRNNREILLAVQKGLPANAWAKDPWKNVTAGAKEVLSGLICLKPDQRFDAEFALKHDWIISHETASPDKKAEMEASTLQSLKSFSGESKMKKAALHAIARRANEKDIAKLRDTFIALDKNEDGVVTFQELQDGCAKLGVKETADLQTMMKELDVDGSLCIDYTEFIAGTMSKRMFHEEQVLWSAFCVFDKDNSGSINRKELELVLKHEDVQDLMGDECIVDAMKNCDSDADGTIDFKEFMAMMRA